VGAEGVDGDMDAVIEGESTVVGVDGSSGWHMRQQMEALLRPEPRHPLKRSWSGAMREGWGRLPELLSIHDNSKSGGDEEMLEKKENEKTLTRQREQV
jgi:hypothetical protein